MQTVLLMQLAAAATAAGAEGAAELAALEAAGGMRIAAVSTAVNDCLYRPYTQRQVRGQGVCCMCDACSCIDRLNGRAFQGVIQLFNIRTPHL